MKKSKKTIIYLIIIISVFVFQNVFFDIKLFADDNVKVLEAIAESCIVHWIWYSFDKDKWCVCDNPAKDDKCENGFVKNKYWCCIGSCGVCSSNSVEFQKYINFQVELYGLLLEELNQDKENKQSGGFRQGGLFSSRVLSIPVNIRKSRTKIFKKVGQEYVDTKSTIVVWSTIITSIVTESRKDMLGGLMILYKSKALVRERNTIQSLDLIVYDLMRDLNTTWLWNKEISNDTKIKLEQLNKKYIKTEQNQKWMFEKFYLQWSIKYKDLINVSKKINSLMKNFILTWKEGDSFMKSFEKEFSKGNIVVQFSEHRKNNLINDYVCARRINACKEDFSHLINVNWLKNSFSNSMSIIKQANKNLAEIFTDKEKHKDKESNPYWLTDKQIELLRTIYGINTSKITQQQGVTLGYVFKKTAQVYNQIKNQVNLKISDYATKKQEQENKKNIKNTKNKEQDEKYINKLSKEEQKKIEKALKEQTEKIEKGETTIAFTNIIETILNERDENKEIILFYDTNSTNRYFTETIGLIQDIIKNDIWNKDTQGLVKYLWEACTYQCANKGTTNCFK
jgi:hypothetical protein